MQLPVDIKALLNEMTDIDAARKTPLSVSLYVDEAAAADLVAHVRGAFTSSVPTVRMTLSYLDDTFLPHPTDDVAVMVAGASSSVGAAAVAVRAVGVPVMVVTLLPEMVNRLAREGGHAIPEGDVVAPGAADSADGVLPSEAAAELDARMGAWMVSACRDKKLALSLAFPFVRRPLAKDAVQQTSLQNAGIGLVPLVPGADLPVMTLNQAKMVLQIAAAYGSGMGKERAKELAAVVGGAYLCRVVARELVEFVPVLGFAVRPGIAYGGTAAMGNAVIEYFEGGENVAGVANVASSAVRAGSKLAANAAEVASDPSKLRFDKLRGAASAVRDAVDEYGPKVADLVDEYAPKVMGAIAGAVPAAR